MKLKNLIAPLQQNFRKTLSLLKLNPLSDRGKKAIANKLANRGRRKLENLEFPPTDSPANRGNTAQKTFNYHFASFANLYPQYEKCDNLDPLGCDRSLETLRKSPTAKFCSRCGFLAQLPKGKQIRGKKGIYEIERFLERQGNGRIYAAVDRNNGRSVVFKEYLLPRRSFPEETDRQQIKAIFAKAVNFRVAEAIATDFRLIIPQEGISDKNHNRCYLVTSDNLAALPSLKAYLIQKGRIKPERVITLLDQVLQSLEFLHSQKWQFTSGEIEQGLVHGNLSLDSLLIKETEVGFLVYLWDLSCWENLFDPKQKVIPHKTQKDDLAALGNIGFYLLATEEIVTASQYPLDPRNEAHWRGISDPLKSFLLRLLGLNSAFDSAAVARKELSYLKPNKTQRSAIEPTVQPLSAKKTVNYWLISSAMILLIGGVIWWLRKKDGESAIANFSGKCCIEDILDDTAGNFTYGSVESEKLGSIFEINFDSENRSTYIEFAKNDRDLEIEPENALDFIDIISHKQQLNLKPKSFANREDAIANLDPYNTNFALVNLPLNKYSEKFLRDDGEEIVNTTIAYDGLLVYVPFAGCQNCEELASYLEQKITLNQLRDIYTGKVAYWHEINPEVPDRLKIRAFVPQDAFAQKMFEQLVFQDNAEDIADFRKAIASAQITQLESNAIIRRIREQWIETKNDAVKIGGIGFDLQSIVYKQCNVYPLAVVHNDSDRFDMLVKKDKTGVNLFQDGEDCKEKVKYQLNEAIFQTENSKYPLAFAVNLLYPNNNENQNLELGQKITEIAKTKEFQCHLSHKKLIPLELSEEDCGK